MTNVFTTLAPGRDHLCLHLHLHRRPARLRRVGVRPRRGHLLLQRVPHLPLLPPLRHVPGFNVIQLYFFFVAGAAASAK